MIDLAREQIIPLGELANHPAVRRATGRRLHKSAVYRWVRPGVAGVRLEIGSAGRTAFTSIEAVARFFARVAEARTEQARPVCRSRSVRPRETRVEQAERQLAAEGI